MRSSLSSPASAACTPPTSTPTPSRRPGPTSSRPCGHSSKPGKLGAVLLQYPEWFTAKKDNRAELAAIRDHWGDLPVCVEFRSPTWLATPENRDRTLHTLTDLHLALVVLDAPKTSKLRTVVKATSPDLAVVRFHGRNDDTWKKPGTTAAERFDYLYSRPQLRAWVPKLETLAEQATTVHALMNNCYQDYGVRNAADLAGLLGRT